jgi:hypothetical protein
MDFQGMFERHLVLTERRIVELELNVERQRTVVAGLEAAGRGGTESAEIARDLLSAMERNLGYHVADRKRIGVLLRAAKPDTSGR